MTLLRPEEATKKPKVSILGLIPLQVSLCVVDCTGVAHLSSSTGSSSLFTWHRYRMRTMPGSSRVADSLLKVFVSLKDKVFQVRAYVNPPNN